MQATRNLRVVFWFCTIALLAGSHYPKLEVGTPGDAPDKLLHFFAYGGWAVLLVGTGYIKSLPLVAILAIAFGVFDELTQAIPMLGRSPDPWDLVADGAGGVVAVVWIHALGPTGVDSPVIRRGEEAMLEARWRLLASPINLGHLLVAFVFGVLIGGVVLSIVLKGNPVIGSTTAVVFGGCLGGLAGWFAVFQIGQQRMRVKLFDAEKLPAPVPEAPMRRQVLVVVGWIVGVLVGLTLLNLIAIALSPSISMVGWFVRRHEQLGTNLALMIDTALLFFVAAWAVRRSRIKLARLVAEGGNRCVACQQDLRGTPFGDGTGRCPECGHQFQRS